MSTQTKHTPGPWFAKRLGNPYDQHTVYVEKTGRTIVTSCEGEANARLIAAGPELLEACQHMLNFFKSQYPEAFEAGGMSAATDGGPVFELDLDGAKSAIAKATGGKP